jgi:hypothetical protein
MPMIRIRMIGSRDHANTLINALHGIDGIEHVEEVDDLMENMRDDSSSSELVDDEGGELVCVEVRAPDARHAEAVRDVAEFEAQLLDVVVEFVEEF